MSHYRKKSQPGSLASIFGSMRGTRREDGRLVLNRKEDEPYEFSRPGPRVPIPRNNSNSRIPVNLDPINEISQCVDHLYRVLCKDASCVEKLTDDEQKSKAIKKIEVHIDRMAGLISQDLDWISNDPVITSEVCVNRKLHGHCNRYTKCSVLPGFKKKKSLVPQLYHILQDYGLFFDMGIENNDTLSFKILRRKSNRWLIDIGEELGMSVERVSFLRKIMIRVRRVQFLRSFDEKCCKVKDENHRFINDLLEDIYEALEDKLECIVE